MINAEDGLSLSPPEKLAAQKCRDRRVKAKGPPK